MTPLAWLLAVPLWADVLVLKNGNEMEGLVVSTNAQEIVLDMGFGTTALPRRSVAKIRRSSPEDAERIHREHRKKFFDSGRWVPKSCEDVFARYTETGRAREAGTDAKKRRDSLTEEEARLSADLGGLEGQARYDAWKRLQEISTLLPAAEREMQAYFSKFKALESALPETPKGTEEEKEFHARLTEAVAEMSKEFNQDTIVSRKSGSHLVVQAVLDGRVPCTLMVDTGASLTTISPAIAAKLTPVPGSESDGLTSLADGRRVKVKVFRVSTLEVGRSKEELVPVAVLPSPGNGVDGLLGMSFLEHFAVQVDAQSGQLMLNRLR
ncbi:MAG: clan AA aspartic protease [Elusimicrobia bacterium]|nr:clan AA aspartic protease [Elusimicrobiota bacterium]